MFDRFSYCYSAQSCQAEVTGGIICLHKGRGKTLQSDSCRAKEWGIEWDKDREAVWVKSRAGESEREAMTKWEGVKKDKMGTFLCSVSKGYTLYTQQCQRSCRKMFR